jgi:hypothetical protein
LSLECHDIIYSHLLFTKLFFFIPNNHLKIFPKYSTVDVRKYALFRYAGFMSNSNTCSRYNVVLIYCLDDGGSTYLWNVGRQLLYTAVHPRRQILTSYATVFFTLELQHICHSVFHSWVATHRPLCFSLWVATHRPLLCFSLWVATHRPLYVFHSELQHIGHSVLFTQSCNT